MLSVCWLQLTPQNDIRCFGALMASDWIEESVCQTDNLRQGKEIPIRRSQTLLRGESGWSQARAQWLLWQYAQRVLSCNRVGNAFPTRLLSTFIVPVENRPIFYRPLNISFNEAQFVWTLQQSEALLTEAIWKVILIPNIKWTLKVWTFYCLCSSFL